MKKSTVILPKKTGSFAARFDNLGKKHGIRQNSGEKAQNSAAVLIRSS